MSPVLFRSDARAYAAAQRPDLVAALVAVGMDIDGAAAGQCLRLRARRARQRGHQRATRQLEAIGPPPHLTRNSSPPGSAGRPTSAESHWRNLRHLGRGLLASLMRSPDYSGPDVLRTVRGISATQAALLPELASLDLAHTLPRLEVPVVMAQGRLDQVAPGTAAQRYASTLEAPSKELVWSENSAHTPHLEEPDKFRDLLMGVRASQRCSRMSRSTAGSHDRRSHERGALLDALRRRRPPPRWPGPSTCRTSSAVTEKDREADMHDRHFLARTRRSPAQIPSRRDASARHRLAEMIGRLLPSGDVNG